MTKIQILRGSENDLPISARVGEPIYATNTKKLFIGSGFGKDLVGSAALCNGADASSLHNHNTSYYTKSEVDTTLSGLEAGLPYIYGDDIYFYDNTREKHLSVTVIQVNGGRNSSNTTDQYLRNNDGIPFNLSGNALPFDATLVGISVTGEINKSQSWTLQVRKNGSADVIESLSIENDYKNYDWTKNVDFSARDIIQLYLSGTDISYPRAEIYFRRKL
jgi:hypothetical protein